MNICCYNRPFDDQLLSRYLGDIEAERFVSLILREPFDYTKWRQGQWDDLSLEEISQRAMALRRKDRTI